MGWGCGLSSDYTVGSLKFIPEIAGSTGSSLIPSLAHTADNLADPTRIVIPVSTLQADSIGLLSATGKSWGRLFLQHAIIGDQLKAYIASSTSSSALAPSPTLIAYGFASSSDVDIAERAFLTASNPIAIRIYIFETSRNDNGPGSLIFLQSAIIVHNLIAIITRSTSASALAPSLALVADCFTGSIRAVKSISAFQADTVAMLSTARDNPVFRLIGERGEG